MNRVLSLLLLVPFLITQVLTVTPAFARGGPYDDMLSTSQSTLAGTYGVALTGDNYHWDDLQNSSSVTGVMALSVPAVGIATGRVLLFDRGLMYMGTAQGITDTRSGKMRLLSQLSHYIVFFSPDKGVTPSTAMVDSIYSGQIDLQLSVDYLSGLIQAEGSARFSDFYAEANPIITARQANQTSTNLQMSASGMRQSATVATIAAFTLPSLATSFQIDAPVTGP